jgi:hypothetical protein
VLRCPAALLIRRLCAQVLRCSRVSGSHARAKVLRSSGVKVIMVLSGQVLMCSCRPQMPWVFRLLNAQAFRCSGTHVPFCLGAQMLRCSGFQVLQRRRPRIHANRPACKHLTCVEVNDDTPPPPTRAIFSPSQFNPCDSSIRPVEKFQPYPFCSNFKPVNSSSPQSPEKNS